MDFLLEFVSGSSRCCFFLLLFNELELLTPVDVEQRFKVAVSEMEMVTLRKT